MKLEAFVEEFDCAPLDITEFAEAAQSVIDCPELSTAATLFLTAAHDFENIMLEQGVEIG